MVRSSIIFLVLIMIVFAASVVAQPPGSGASAPPEDHARSPLKLTVKLDKGTFTAADTIHITLLLKNPTKKPVAVTFATGQKYDVFLLKQPVDKKAPEVVWQWSLGMMFTQMVTRTNIGAGQTVQYEAKYPPDDGTKQQPLTKGIYSIKAAITTIGSSTKPEATVKFRVK